MSEAQFMVELVDRYGLMGLALVSFVNNIVPGLPAFYLTFISAYAAVSDSSRWMLAVLSAGVGAGLGKVALFAISLYIFSKTGRGKKVRAYSTKLLASRRTKLSLAIAIFLVASLPIPDDIIYIPLAATFYNILYFSAAVIAGKLLLSSLMYALGVASRDLLINALQLFLPEIPTTSTSPTLIALLVAASLAISIAFALLVLTIDWTRIYVAYVEKGERAAIRELLSEISRLARIQN
ncbi:MAG: hypothetical protein F7B20_06500 [Aeropyrum sp.]|nr:hypothetical protein [Aeropyrum sp.]MCE4616329.1 hypothetical protein [Aeropyrum sp.]